MNAADTAAALARCAEAVCRHYLPRGRRQGRYWVVGDIDGACGRSLYVRLTGPGIPGKWNDAATGQHGDLLDLIQCRPGTATLRNALREAHAFLGLLPDSSALHYPPPAGPTGAEARNHYDGTAAAQRLWERCRSIGNTHAEAYLHARGLARCRFAALRFHPALCYREDDSVRLLPALVAAVTRHDGRVLGVQRTWLDPVRPAKANIASPRKALGRIHGHAVRFGHIGSAPLLVGEGIETILSIITAVPAISAAAALSAGSLGEFAPPPDIARLVIARDNDPEGEQAAARLALRCARVGIAAAIIVSQGGDFNDDLAALGPHTLATRILPCLP